jgi:single-strand DNA-binding protein
MIIGRLGQDPKTSYTLSGSCAVSLSIATDESYKDNSGQKVEKTEWHRIVAFGQPAEWRAGSETSAGGGKRTVRPSSATA